MVFIILYNIFNYLIIYIYNLIGDYCTDEQVISQAQRYQFRKARHELYGNDRISAMSYQSDFYRHHFGSYSVEVIEPKKDISTTLVYYGIARNGNENICTHLANFSSLFTMNPSGHCPSKETCARVTSLSRKDTINKMKKKYQTLHHSKRFIFTFIRNPIARFISGYTEIEYALKEEGIKSVYDIPLYGELGSIERFKDFIKGLVASNGARSYLKDIKVGITHIAPQIGSLLVAEEIEGRHSHYIHLYHLETFESEWKQLAKDSNQQKLLNVLTENDIIPHHTHIEDKYNTSKAAWTFLNQILNTSNTYSNLSQKLLNETMKKKNDKESAKKYVRVLCRIYLMDFICLGNYMPPICDDLKDELHEFLGEYDLITKKIERSYYNIIKEYYLYFRHIFAEIVYCIISGNPECITDFVHSNKVSTRDKYQGDEL